MGTRWRGQSRRRITPSRYGARGGIRTPDLAVFSGNRHPWGPLTRTRSATDVSRSRPLSYPCRGYDRKNEIVCQDLTGAWVLDECSESEQRTRAIAQYVEAPQELSHPQRELALAARQRFLTKHARQKVQRRVELRPLHTTNAFPLARCVLRGRWCQGPGTIR